MMRMMRRLRRPIDERGAVAVEAALITPILITLIFGAIEFSLLLRDNVAVTSLVRSGARIASAEPRLGTVASCKSAALVPGCFAQDAADAIQRAGSALPKNSIEYIWVYLPNASGYPSQSANWKTDGTNSFNGTCTASYCYTYKWVDGSPGRFTYQSGAWDPQSINACLNDPNAMSVGVYMKVNHKGVVGLFFSSFALTDYAVMKFEPKTNETCK